jgi:hypothetical protein
MQGVGKTMKIKIAENLKLREVQALETLLGLAYNGEKKKVLGICYPNLGGFSWTLGAPNGL